jgi:hypothetical protein
MSALDVRAVLIDRARGHVRATLFDEGEAAWWRNLREAEAEERARRELAAKAERARRGIAQMKERRAKTAQAAV